MSPEATTASVSASITLYLIELEPQFNNKTGVDIHNSFGERS
jgi:ABC-type molybdate transport system substrate-binding protein